MKTHVDFEFSKNFAGRVKGDVKSIYKPQARRLQDIRKVGKIIGPTVSPADRKILDDARKIIEKEVADQVGGLKKENEALKKENAKLKKTMPVPNNKRDKQAESRQTK